MTLTIWLLFLTHEILAAGVQIAFKKGINLQPEANLRGWQGYLHFIKNVFRCPAIWCGIALTAMTWFLWFIILAKIDLSVAVPLDSLQSVLILLAAYLFLRERISWMRSIGTFLILAGIFLVAAS